MTEKNKKFSVCFTGHRNIACNKIFLQQILYITLEKTVIDKDCVNFYNGAAIGWDMLTAEMVLKLRTNYPHIKLHIILPCSSNEQTAKWNYYQKQNYCKIINAADTVEQLSEKYYNGCMKARNQKLVDMSDCCICYYDPNQKRSGTGQTVRMAEKKNIPVINFFGNNSTIVID